MEIHSIDGLVSISATGGTKKPYLGYTAATVEFPHIPNYSEEVVVLVISDPTEYARRVPLQIGTRVIAAVTQTLTPIDLAHLDETWKQTYVGTMMSCAAQQKKDPGDSFNLDKVKGPIKLRKEEILEPLEHKEVWAYTQVKGHSRRVVVCIESQDLLMQGQVMSVSTKVDLLPHRSRVKVLLRNLSSRAVKIPAKTTIGIVSPCNVIPDIWKPEEGSTSGGEEETWSKDLQNLFEKLGLNEPQEWMTPEDVLEAKKLVKKLHMIFSKNDLD